MTTKTKPEEKRPEYDLAAWDAPRSVCEEVTA
jgi:hypothetical protein